MGRWQIVVVVTRERHADITLRFDHAPVTIGGAAGSDVVLAGPHVSRAHAVVTVSGGRIVYQDRSSNGSFVDDRRVSELTLGPDDVVVVPPYRMTFSLQAEHDQRTIPLPPLDQMIAASADGAAPISVAPPVVPAAPEHMDVFTLRLVQAPGSLINRSFTFGADGAEEIVVGRAADADVCLDIPSVSRQHAVLALSDDGGWRVSDQGSRNGIAVNGEKTSGAFVVNGDRIGFGPDVTAVFEQPQRNGVTPSWRPAIESAVAQSPPLSTADPLSTPVHDTPDDALRVADHRSALDGGVVVVDVGGRVDGYNYTDFRDRLNQIIDRGDHLLVINFTDCNFCDHVGLSVVVSAKAALDKRRGRLCLMGVDERLGQGLKLLRLDTLFAIERDESAAVRRLLK